MCLWRRKKVEEKAVCDHKYKPFPWYIGLTKDHQNSIFTLYVKQPFVCVKCKHRLDRVLFKSDYNTYETASDARDTFLKKYSEEIQPSVETEAAISEMQLVDKEFLKDLEVLESKKDDIIAKILELC